MYDDECSEPFLKNCSQNPTVHKQNNTNKKISQISHYTIDWDTKMLKVYVCKRYDINLV